MAFFSRSLTSAERNYPTHDRELLAIVTACKRWRPYLDGQRTTCWTDHKPLCALDRQASLNKRQIRWLDTLAETPLHIQYKPGREQVVTDALSRLPRADSAPPTAPAAPDLPTAQTPLPSASEVACSSIVVEPSFLRRLSQHQFDESDQEMARLVATAKTQNPEFRIINQRGL